MFSTKLTLELDYGYVIEANPHKHHTEVILFKNESNVGSAFLVTDDVDVSCITRIEIDEMHVDQVLSGQHSVGEVMLKFLLKFPSCVRKPEFRFILNVPENFAATVAKYHFDQSKDSSLQNEILIRQNVILPDLKMPAEITFREEIEETDLQKIFSLLQENAYWQTHLTMERLNLLLAHSKCFLACDNNKIIGFARVLTDEINFASLWDVVVEKTYRQQGIGKALMYQIFSNIQLRSIENWVLFTDTAKFLYEKFGFVAISETSQKNLMHKLRLQTSHPTYMSELLNTIQQGLPVRLSAKQSMTFLFDEEGKRSKLSQFWKSAASATAINPTDPLSLRPKNL